jgi:hypothetical protein
MFNFTTVSERASALSLRSGSASLYTGGLKHRVVQVTVHPRYTKFSEDYDVAIIKVFFNTIICPTSALTLIVFFIGTRRF